MSMFCYQCEMSQKGGCGSTGATVGTCGKDENLSRLQDIMIFGLKVFKCSLYALRPFNPKIIISCSLDKFSSFPQVPTTAPVLPQPPF